MSAFCLQTQPIYEMDISSVEENIITTLTSYQKLSSDFKNHPELIKDKTILLYTANLLETENQNTDILTLCLNILENLIKNEKTHIVLLTVFGIYEAIKLLAINTREVYPGISDRATDLIEKLEKGALPAYTLRQQLNPYKRKLNYMYHLYIEELDDINRPLLDDILIKIRGILSFVIDVDKKRCTLRINNKTTVDHIVTKIQETCSMRPLVVARNLTTGEEKYVDPIPVGDTSFNYSALNISDISSNDHNAIKLFTSILSSKTNDLLKCAVDFWNKSFYW